MVKFNLFLDDVLQRIWLGSDRFEIHLHMERPPLVRDLMAEVERKSRVTLANQQLLFRGKIQQENPRENDWFFF